MGEIIVSTGDLKKNYEVIGPIYIQVSNKGAFGSTLTTLIRKYRDEVKRQREEGRFSPKQRDWGFLYGEWGVGQSQFDEAFYVCVRELQERAAKMGGDAIIWLRQDIDLDTSAIQYFYLQMYGTVVRLIDDEINFKRLKRVIDEQYMEIIFKDNPEVCTVIEEKRELISSQEQTLQQRAREIDDKKSDIKNRTKEYEEEISRMSEQVRNLRTTVSKLTAYGHDNKSELIKAKNAEIDFLIAQIKDNKKKTGEILSELKPYNDAYQDANRKLQDLENELKQYEDAL